MSGELQRNSTDSLQSVGMEDRNMFDTMDMVSAQESDPVDDALLASEINEQDWQPIGRNAQEQERRLSYHEEVPPVLYSKRSSMQERPLVMFWLLRIFSVRRQMRVQMVAH